MNRDCSMKLSRAFYYSYRKKDLASRRSVRCSMKTLDWAISSEPDSEASNYDAILNYNN
jgi:hypothetical protein